MNSISSHGAEVGSIPSLQQKYIIMIKYSEEELREMISNLRLFKNFKGGLTDRSKIELTKYEMLLENHLKNKYKEIDEWLNKLMIKNGTTKY